MFLITFKPKLYMIHHYFFLDNENIVRLIDKKLTVDKLHERKYFEIIKNYNHTSDLFIDIKDRKLDTNLNCENSYKDLIQTCIEGEVQST